MSLSYAVFEGNPFQENTYILYDETKECIIIDPGCYNPSEEKRMVDFLEAKNLRPVRLLNTHCHIDHVLGNAFIHSKYDLLPEYHKLEIMVLESCKPVSQSYGIPYQESPKASNFLDVDDTIHFGNVELEIRFVPGHSPGSICFIDHEAKIVVGGDVLFNRSIGRYDLPGGNYETLKSSIQRELYSLEDDYVVLPGHGPTTTIGEEKRENPFVTQD